LPDVPRGGQVGPFGTGGEPFVLPSEDSPRRGHPNWGANPQSRTPGWSDRRRARHAWLKANIGALVGTGAMPDADDVGALPPSVLDETIATCKRIVETFENGDQSVARLQAEEAMVELEARLPTGWMPPDPMRPSAALFDEIRGAH
jgi:hypothetical protein